ncbi:methyl-accepting chemotaxis protein [Stutzerimonas stutzeri]|uniref:Methyl-accepting chemotaxis protein n=1 Tax=Stutzerimonas stutzeri TaxID=316 RepID=A0A2N8T1J2_STUST|nr:methyl-accepting chemotaxis protein [Stutzerimonas stutzeri]MCQ4250661.1 methyl-accepting chemotaxis protein [Stutzerimonas stutzeri]PNG08609.1 methyl-accepting chemotaxis protein [Stutzerimonas stutzeri]QUE77425.1 methyl-accepting chemotaxis protein [Stutzerimonas stutzeri]
MKNWFADISMTRKLAIGFGSVLLLTAALAVYGWHSLGSVTHRGALMAQIASLNESLGELRAARLQYMLDNGDEKSAEAVNAALDRFAGRLAEISPNFSGPENVARLRKQGEQIQGYRAALQKMRDAYAAGTAARADMGTHATLASEPIDTMGKTVERMPADAENRYAGLKAISELRMNWQLVRYQMRGYNTTPTIEVAAKVEQQIAQARQSAARLKAVLGEEFSAQVAITEQALDGYLVALKAVVAQTEAIAAARQEMASQTEEISRLGLALTQDQNARLDQDTSQARITQVTVAVLALLIGMLAAWLITRQITQPLADTLAVVRNIAAGDLTDQRRIERQDEMGALQQGVMGMAATLRELISGIRDSVTQMASAAEQLSAITEQTSVGMNGQKIETDQVATAMHEMSATVQEVARNAEDASQAASDADREARAGDAVVSEAVTQIERLSEEMLRSTEAMAKLESESNRIGSVMDVIKTVAEQTNLLALNAAIEAARAGEAGRGFAVVADEVRGLAQRTQKSTEEIEQLVAGLQQGTQQVAAAMQNSHNLTESSVELTRKAGLALNDITAKVSNIQAMNQQIAAAAEEQGAVAEEISRSVINVRDISEQTATASDETAASSVELARLGGELQAMVSRFRV